MASDGCDAVFAIWSKWDKILIFLKSKNNCWWVLWLLLLDVFKFRRIWKNKSWKKLKISQLCIWKLYTYNTVYCTQGNIYSRFIFTQFSLENIGICKQKLVLFKVILRIWRQQSHTLWNKLVTYQKLDLPIFSCNKKLFKVLDE